jgi:hypothetical protein
LLQHPCAPCDRFADIAGGKWSVASHEQNTDPATSDIGAVEFTPSSDGDSPVLPELLGQIPEGEEIGTVTADGADDTRRCHTAIIDRQAIPIIPIRKNGRP